jgi:hypothetical protein
MKNVRKVSRPETSSEGVGGMRLVRCTVRFRTVFQVCTDVSPLSLM